MAGALEVDALETGPDIVETGAEGSEGPGLGGGRPKPRSASESLGGCLLCVDGVGASCQYFHEIGSFLWIITCSSGSPMSTSTCFFLALRLDFFFSLNKCEIKIWFPCSFNTLSLES